MEQKAQRQEPEAGGSGFVPVKEGRTDKMDPGCPISGSARAAHFYQRGSPTTHTHTHLLKLQSSKQHLQLGPGVQTHEPSGAHLTRKPQRRVCGLLQPCLYGTRVHVLLLCSSCTCQDCQDQHLRKRAVKGLVLILSVLSWWLLAGRLLSG